MKPSNRAIGPLLVIFLLVGCRDERLQTQQGLQEQNAVLQDQLRSEKESVADLRLQVEGYRAELEKVKVNTSRDAAEQIAALKRLHDSELKSFDDHAVRTDETHRKQAAQLEGTISSQQLELGAVRREKLALQELVDREPRGCGSPCLPKPIGTDRSLHPSGRQFAALGLCLRSSSGRSRATASVDHATRF